MIARGAQVPTLGALLLAATATVANVAGGVLLADAVPYLGVVDALTLPMVGVLYAGAAALLVLTASHRSAAPLMLLISYAAASGPLSLGLAQRSSLWVATGAATLLVVPAAAGLAVLIARGEGSSAVGRQFVMGSAVVALAAGVLLMLIHDPAAWGWCQCQSSSVALFGDEKVYVAIEPWLLGLRLVVSALAMAGVAVELVRRPGRVGPAEMALGLAVLGVAIGWLVQPQVTAAGLVLLLVVSLREASRRRPSRAHVADLLLAAREQTDPARLEELVARALGDPEATVWWWVPEMTAYRDHHGTVHAAPDASVSPGRVLKVGTEARPIAMVVAGTRDLPSEASVLDSVAEALRLSTENRRLTEELSDSLEQVRESRARIQSASDEARKRIERDLHDGAQQLLISTGVKLNLASARVKDSEDTQLAETLAEASGQLGQALTELRQLASGITPTALVHGRLRDALEELALRSPVPVSVRTQGDLDAGPARSATAYFVVAECLANVAKHARARSATVDLCLEEPVVVTVADDGRGGADPAIGSGLRGLMDRVDAIGGRVQITSDENGTRVSVVIPEQDHP